MKPEKLIEDLKSSAHQFVVTLRAFPQDRFNTRPAPDKWSAGEIAEHVAILEDVVLPIVTGPGKPSGQQDEDKKLVLMRTAILDLDTKYQAPSFVHPSADPKEAEALIARILAAREALGHAVRGVDLSEIATAAKHPVMGTLTRCEWVYTLIFHGERHRLQIEGLKGRV